MMNERMRTVKYKKIIYARPENVPLYLDLIRPEAAGCFPCIVMVHGGGWCIGDRAGAEALAVRLAAAGYVVANIDYRLAPFYPFPAARDDVRAAVEWMSDHAGEYDGDGAAVGAFGSSSGGHLVALLATMSDTPLACAVSWGGPMDLRDGGGVCRKMQGFALAFLGTCIHDDPDRYADASPRCHLTANMAPLLMVHGTEDDLVPLAQPRRMLQAAEALGASVEALFLDGAGHNPGSPRDPLMIMAWQRINDFYTRHLRSCAVG